MIAVAPLLLTVCNLAAAQARPVRHGIWLDGALGGGWVHGSSATVGGQTQAGFDVVLAGGATLTSRVRAGVGVDQWTSRWGAGTQNWFTSFNVLLYFYPVPHRNLFLEVAAGNATYSVVHVPSGGERADSVHLSGSAGGALVAAGWDAPVGKGFSVRPRLSYSYGPPRDLQSSDGTPAITGWKVHSLSLSVGLVYHPPDSW